MERQECRRSEYVGAGGVNAGSTWFCTAHSGAEVCPHWAVSSHSPSRHQSNQTLMYSGMMGGVTTLTV